MPKLTRRKFIQNALVAIASPELGRNLARPSESNLAPSAEIPPSVAVSRGTDADFPETILKTAFDGLGGLERFIKPGQTVAIKPNATWAYPPLTASSTDPRLLAALILMVKSAGAARITVMDHCSLDPGTANCLRTNGIGGTVDNLGVEKIFPDRNLSPKSLFCQVDLPKGKAFQRLGVIKAAVEADVRINMAVAKSHVVTRLTMCLKHMMGFLEMPSALHAQLEQGIADINTPSPVQAHLHILEAIRVRLPTGPRLQAGGPETDITHPEKIKRLNQVIAGVDPVLIDAYGCLNFFSFKPEEVAHLHHAYESGLGEMDVDKALGEGRLRIFSTGRTHLTSASKMPESQPPVLLEHIEVIDPRPFLRWALIPAAAIFTGLGIMTRRLLKQKKEREKKSEG